jgi:putative transposase
MDAGSLGTLRKNNLANGTSGSLGRSRHARNTARDAAAHEAAVPSAGVSRFHSRESLAIEVGQRLTGDDVVRDLEQVTIQRGKPKTIRVDKGPELCPRSLDLWASFNSVKLDFSRPGKPTDNAVIESFNGRLRDECLNQHWFVSLDETRAVTEAWREDHNRVRLHGALGNRPRVANNPVGTKLGAASAEIPRGASPCGNAGKREYPRQGSNL